jgi:hypothetical protein
MKEENGKTFKIFLIFVGGLISFTLLSILAFQYLIDNAPEGTKLIEFFTVIIILISIVYLGKEEVLNNETTAALLGSMGGYVLGK